MKTDELISLLSATLQPVDAGLLRRAVWASALVAAVLTAAGVVILAGARIDLLAGFASGALPLKALYGAATAAAALLAFERSLQPGAEVRFKLAFVAVPFAATLIWAGVSLANAPLSAWPQLVVGKYWLSCLTLLLLFALVPMAAMILVARRGAPTDSRLTGACAGFVSGGLAIVGFSIHCPVDSVSFVAVWYSLSAIVMAAFGAALFPKIVRW